MHSVRQPAVAGLFYPGDARALRLDIQRYLDQARLRHQPGPGTPPKALIVPHAGYVYSGATAAHAYCTLEPYRHSIHRVVLLGPAHRVKLRGLAISDVENFRTPLGDIPIDQAGTRHLLTLPQVQVMDAAHWQEHSLEVQLPFLQTVLEDFALIPVVIGDATGAEVQQVLDLLWGDAATLIVVSSDLSHYQDYHTAQYLDRATAEAIEHFDFDHIDYHQACGCMGVAGLLRAAKQRQMQVRTLDLCNSGDASGDQQRVVGYGSWAFANG